MAYKLLATAQERWRKFNGHELVADVLDGAKFKDGIRVTDDDNPDDGQQAEGSPPDHLVIAHTQHLTNPEQAGISEFVIHWSRPWDSLMTGAAAAVLEHVAN